MYKIHKAINVTKLREHHTENIIFYLICRQQQKLMAKATCLTIELE